MRRKELVQGMLLSDVSRCIRGRKIKSKPEHRQCKNFADQMRAHQVSDVFMVLAFDHAKPHLSVKPGVRVRLIRIEPFVIVLDTYGHQPLSFVVGNSSDSEQGQGFGHVSVVLDVGNFNTLEMSLSKACTNLKGLSKIYNIKGLGFIFKFEG